MPSNYFQPAGGGGASGSYVYQGTWNAATNTPTLVSSTGTKGYVYKVSAFGTTTLDGISSWDVGDQVQFNGATWDKISGGNGYLLASAVSGAH